MALLSVTKRCTPTDSLVYTTPAGKTARVMSCNINNSHTADVDITIRWHDDSDGPSGTDRDFLTAGRLRQGEWLPRFARALALDAGDTLSVIPSVGQVHVILSLDVIP